jgi:hypothetical protein
MWRVAGTPAKISLTQEIGALEASAHNMAKKNRNQDDRDRASQCIDAQAFTSSGNKPPLQTMHSRLIFHELTRPAPDRPYGTIGGRYVLRNLPD